MLNSYQYLCQRGRAQLFIDYLGYEEIVGAPKEIRLDFSMDMERYGKTQSRKLLETYSDLRKQNSKLSVMTLNTILANKLGLLLDLTRNEPRDLYDVWFLLQRLEAFDYDFTEVRDVICHWFHGHSSLSSRHHTLELYW